MAPTTTVTTVMGLLHHSINCKIDAKEESNYCTGNQDLRQATYVKQPKAHFSTGGHLTGENQRIQAFFKDVQHIINHAILGSQDKPAHTI